MPGKVADKNPRCRLEQALKTRTTLSSEFSPKIRGRNLALTCGSNRQVRTWYLKQQLAVKDMEADRIRLLAPMSKRKPARRFSDDPNLFHDEAALREPVSLDDDDLTVQKQPHNQHHHHASQRPTPKNSSVLLLEKQLARQRELHGFGRSSFRKINVYKIDKATGEVVRSFDSMPVECLFPALTISSREKAAMEISSINAEGRPSTDQTSAATSGGNIYNYQQNNNGGNNSGPATHRTETAGSDSESVSTHHDAASRQRARGDDKGDLLATSPVKLSRTQTYISGRMKSFIASEELFNAKNA